MTAPIDEARLRELAEAATPGPWVVHEPRGQASLVVGREEVGPRHSLVKVLQPANAKNERGKNAAFIAAANPAAICALLDALSAERERAEYRIAEAYQVIGAIAHAGGLFEHPDVQRALTYFSEAEPKGEILPFSLADQNAGGEKT